jgi:hypothetical protein
VPVLRKNAGLPGGAVVRTGSVNRWRGWEKPAPPETERVRHPKATVLTECGWGDTVSMPCEVIGVEGIGVSGGCGSAKVAGEERCC